MNYNLAFIGFGVVGQGFAEILQEKKTILKKYYNLDYSVVAISDPVKGSVYQPKGLELNQILSLVKEQKSINNYTEGIKGWDSIKTIKESNANVIVEVTPTNINTGEPGLTYIKIAINLGKHVITTNKGPIALAYNELLTLSKKKGVFIKFEGTVLSGTPVISLGLESLAGIEIKEVRGILNGTTNYILTEMEMGKTYDEALKEAQRLGYAEAKPDADVEGWDALAKILIVANVVMGGNLKVTDVARVGITEITQEDIKSAKSEGNRWKLIGKTWREGNKIKAKVAPEKVGQENFLFNVNGVKNAITFVTDTLGDVTIVGQGAGKKETGTAILTDLLNIHRLLKGR
ncbi:MAG: homoserine dehydrogenase [bacterium]|nr:homoserine dehydrogenase [bacterium]